MADNPLLWIVFLVAMAILFGGPVAGALVAIAGAFLAAGGW